MLFHEIYGSYYLVTAGILREAVRGKLTGKKLNDIVRKYAFGESSLTIPEGLTGEKWRLLHRDLSTPIMEEPSMPLTTLEKRWMKSVLLDPRIELFEPDTKGLEDVDPLFKPEMLVYYDRYTDGDDYRDPAYIDHFHTILKALREKRNLYLCYETRQHTKLKLFVTPYYLEYSEKDDRFRLVASGWKRRWTFNLSQIMSCEIADHEERIPYRESEKRSITFELEDRRKAMERVLLHFSHLEKETKRLDNNRYRVTLKYDKQDETEMVIRILSFGPVIRVVEPEHFIGLLKERIERQKTFSK